MAAEEGREWGGAGKTCTRLLFLLTSVIYWPSGLSGPPKCCPAWPRGDSAICWPNLAIIWAVQLASGRLLVSPLVSSRQACKAEAARGPGGGGSASLGSWASGELGGVSGWQARQKQAGRWARVALTHRDELWARCARALTLVGGAHAQRASGNARVHPNLLLGFFSLAAPPHRQAQLVVRLRYVNAGSFLLSDTTLLSTSRTSTSSSSTTTTGRPQAPAAKQRH